MFQITKKSMSILEVIKLFEENSINMTPRYQRKSGIWKTKDNQLLIDSIFNGIDLPKFYFHMFPQEGNYKYAVVDGKQRITAIIDFYNNKFPMASDFRYFEGGNEASIKGLFYHEIEEKYPRVAGKFLSYMLDFSMIDTDEIDRIDNMFIRINMGVKVNTAEKRKAYGGKLIDLISETANQNPFFVNTVTIKDNRNDFQELFLKLYVLEKSNQIVTLNEGDINEILRDEKDCNIDSSDIISLVDKRLREISSAFGTREKIFKKNNVILFYWFLRDKQIKEGRVVEFLRYFEHSRLDKNVREEQKSPSYQRFNELTRQGLYQKSNMEERLEILEREFGNYL